MDEYTKRFERGQEQLHALSKLVLEKLTGDYEILGSATAEFRESIIDRWTGIKQAYRSVDERKRTHLLVLRRFWPTSNLSKYERLTQKALDSIACVARKGISEEPVALSLNCYALKRMHFNKIGPWKGARSQNPWPSQKDAVDVKMDSDKWIRDGHHPRDFLPILEELNQDKLTELNLMVSGEGWLTSKDNSQAAVDDNQIDNWEDDQDSQSLTRKSLRRSSRRRVKASHAREPRAAESSVATSSNHQSDPPRRHDWNLRRRAGQARMNTSKPIIAILGSLNVDLVTRTPRIPAAGETLEALSFNTGHGGKGANQAVACARLSRPSKSSATSSSSAQVDVRMIGAIGKDDAFGGPFLAALEADGLDVTRVRRLEGQKTGVAVITVEERTGENRIMFVPGANHSVPREPLLDGDEDVLVLQLETPLEVVSTFLLG